MELNEDLLLLSQKTHGISRQAFLLCPKCEKPLPLLRLREMKGSIVIDIKCQHCQNKNDKYLRIEDYLTSIKQIMFKARYCSNKATHSRSLSVLYCINCAKWLCDKCNDDHLTTYSQLANHIRIPTEVITDIKCSAHKGKSCEFYCNECEQSFCNECTDKHTINNHQIIKKQVLFDSICNVKSEDIAKKFKAIRKRNEAEKDKIIEEINEQVNRLEDLRLKVISSYKTNDKQNESIYELFQIASSNYAVLKELASLELMNNLKFFSEVNNEKPAINELLLEKKCIQLMNYYKNNYIIKVQHKKEYPNGEKFNGDCVNGRKEGFGVYQWADGRIYKGQFRDGKPNGQGWYSFPSGETYQGGFVNGKKEGKGVYQWRNGIKYEGEWKNDLKHGKGVYSYLNGDSYDGDWAEGKKEGYGVYTYSNVNYQLIYGEKKNGRWINGKMVNYLKVY